MRRIARFEKVSAERFVRDWRGVFEGCGQAEAMEIYERIKLPARATAGSAGYDFFLPADMTLNHGESVVIPTGARCEIDEGWVLKIYPRSGLGFKYRIRLDNTVGIIDGDYCRAENEGHIIIKLTNESTAPGNNAALPSGSGFAQGIFTEYGVTVDDGAEGVRRGGFGSTG
jgi:dUTP pyrophosphatase